MLDRALVLSNQIFQILEHENTLPILQMHHFTKAMSAKRYREHGRLSLTHYHAHGRMSLAHYAAHGRMSLALWSAHRHMAYTAYKAEILTTPTQ